MCVCVCGGGGGGGGGGVLAKSQASQSGSEDPNWPDVHMNLAGEIPPAPPPPPNMLWIECQIVCTFIHSFIHKKLTYNDHFVKPIKHWFVYEVKICL